MSLSAVNRIFCRKSVLTAAALLLATVVAHADSWRFAIIGDTPYSAAERKALPGMLEAIADANSEFVVHIGDIKSGRSRCSDALYKDRLEVFENSRIPFIYVPGDNEWSDCDRVASGSYDPLERLARLRTLFWNTDHSLGKRKIPLERQLGTYAEHSRFRHGALLFVTLNVPGGDNNWGLARTPSAEFSARNPQVIHWLKEAFAQARQEKLRGIVIMMQADPDFHLFQQGMQNAAYQELLETLRTETRAFQGEVLLVHGDTHFQRTDQPLRTPQGELVANFTRLESYGFPAMGWVEVIVDPDGERLFRFVAHPWLQNRFFR
jgi:hypothetical protein